MRLINIKTLYFEEFFDDAIPPYAILSHTWGLDEVTFQEWTHFICRPSEKAGLLGESITAKAGYNKIMKAIATAVDHELSYLWVDTNCIDKTSSAELSEAINSMFDWYTESRVCIVYLEDVEAFSDCFDDLKDEFRKSRWFTRGWTLQELLAPENVIFYDKQWKRIGEKHVPEIASEIVAATGIQDRYLSYPGAIYLASVAERMSWLSNRTTTRVEDMAYCMLGIFDINM
jgi:hypothetical protein